MDREATAARLASGGALIDIGQLDAAAKRFLRREVEAKRAELFVSYAFPAPKRGYVAVGARPVAALAEGGLALANMA